MAYKHPPEILEEDTDTTHEMVIEHKRDSQCTYKKLRPMILDMTSDM